MNNTIYNRMLEIIKMEKEDFTTLINADNTLNLNVTDEDILNFLEFTASPNVLNGPIVGQILITEGDILSILKIIHDIVNHNGVFTLFINDNNQGTNTYFVKLANKIYKEFNLNVSIKIDYSKNYNLYLNELVTIIGSEDFVLTSRKDFKNANQIIV